MTSETALRRYAQALERLRSRLIRSLRHVVGRLLDAVDHDLLVLKLSVLGSDGTDHDVLVQREVLERLEASRPLVVVLQVKGVDVEAAQELLGDLVVGALAEVLRPDVVCTSADHYPRRTAAAEVNR